MSETSSSSQADKKSRLPRWKRIVAAGATALGLTGIASVAHGPNVVEGAPVAVERLTKTPDKYIVDDERNAEVSKIAEGFADRILKGAEQNPATATFHEGNSLAQQGGDKSPQAKKSGSLVVKSEFNGKSFMFSVKGVEQDETGHFKLGEKLTSVEANTSKTEDPASGTQRTEFVSFWHDTLPGDDGEMPWSATSGVSVQNPSTGTAESVSGRISDMNTATTPGTTTMRLYQAEQRTAAELNRIAAEAHI